MTPVTPPPGAVGWTVADGWLFDEHTAAAALDRGSVHVVAQDGHCHVGDHEHAPIASVMRADRQRVELAIQIDDLQRMHARLSERVGDLGDKQAGLDTDQSMELIALKRRVRQLEER